MPQLSWKRTIRLAALVLSVGCGIAWLIAAAQGSVLVLVRTPKSQLAMLSMGIEAFMVDHGRYPTQEEGLHALLAEPLRQDGYSGWRGPYAGSQDIADLWGHPYVYAYPGRHGSAFDISSPGKDGAYGTADDVNSWDLETLEQHYRSGCRHVWVTHPLPTVFGWGFAVSLAVLLTVAIIDPFLSNRRTQRAT